MVLIWGDFAYWKEFYKNKEDNFVPWKCFIGNYSANENNKSKTDYGIYKSYKLSYVINFRWWFQDSNCQDGDW